MPKMGVEERTQNFCTSLKSQTITKVFVFHRNNEQNQLFQSAISSIVNLIFSFLFYKDYYR